MDDKQTAAKLLDQVTFATTTDEAVSAIVAALEAARSNGYVDGYSKGVKHSVRIDDALEAARDTAFAAGYAAGKVQLKGSDVELQRHPDSPYRDCIIDCTGEVPVVRRVTKTLPLTKDGCEIRPGMQMYFSNGIEATVLAVWFDHTIELQSHDGDGLPLNNWKNLRAKDWGFSTPEAARAAMEGRTA
jgi:hypothetical protein